MDTSNSDFRETHPFVSCVMEAQPSMSREEQLLSTLVYLDNGSIGYLITVNKVTGSWTCHACYPFQVPFLSLLEKHLTCAIHLSKMSQSYFPANHFLKAHPENNRGVGIPSIRFGAPMPVVNVVENGLARIQASLDCIFIPLVGIEFVVELFAQNSTEKAYYMCTLCDKRGDLHNFLRHLNSLTHWMAYLRRYFKKFSDALDLLMVPFLPEHKPILLHVIGKIEEAYGRMKPTVINASINDLSDEQIVILKRQIHDGKHIIEKPEDIWMLDMINLEFVENPERLQEKFPLKKVTEKNKREEEENQKVEMSLKKNLRITANKSRLHSKSHEVYNVFDVELIEAISDKDSKPRSSNISSSDSAITTDTRCTLSPRIHPHSRSLHGKINRSCSQTRSHSLRRCRSISRSPQFNRNYSSSRCYRSNKRYESSESNTSSSDSTDTTDTSHRSPPRIHHRLRSPYERKSRSHSHRSSLSHSHRSSRSPQNNRNYSSYRRRFRSKKRYESSESNTSSDSRHTRDTRNLRNSKSDIDSKPRSSSTSSSSSTDTTDTRRRSPPRIHHRLRSPYERKSSSQTPMVVKPKSRSYSHSRSRSPQNNRNYSSYRRRFRSKKRYESSESNTSSGDSKPRSSSTSSSSSTDTTDTRRRSPPRIHHHLRSPYERKSCSQTPKVVKPKSRSHSHSRSCSPLYNRNYSSYRKRYRSKKRYESSESNSSNSDSRHTRDTTSLRDTKSDIDSKPKSSSSDPQHTRDTRSLSDTKSDTDSTPRSSNTSSSDSTDTTDIRRRSPPKSHPHLRSPFRRNSLSCSQTPVVEKQRSCSPPSTIQGYPHPKNFCEPHKERSIINGEIMLQEYEKFIEEINTEMEKKFSYCEYNPKCDLMYRKESKKFHDRPFEELQIEGKHQNTNDSEPEWIIYLNKLIPEMHGDKVNERTEKIKSNILGNTNLNKSFPESPFKDSSLQKNKKFIVNSKTYWHNNLEPEVERESDINKPLIDKIPGAFPLISDSKDSITELNNQNNPRENVQIDNSLNSITVSPTMNTVNITITPTSKHAKAIVPGVDIIDKFAKAQQIINALLPQGKANVIQDESEITIYSKTQSGDNLKGTTNVLSNINNNGAVLKTIYEDLMKKEEVENKIYDQLSFGDIINLLIYFEDLTTREKYGFIAYLKIFFEKHPYEVKKFRKLL